LDGWWENSSQ